LSEQRECRKSSIQKIGLISYLPSLKSNLCL